MKQIKVQGEEDMRGEIQQKLIIYQLMQKRMEELQQHAMLLERRFMEIEITKQAISDMEKLGENSELFFPLGSGVYARGKVAATKDMMIEAGAGLMLKRSPEAAGKLLDAKVSDIEKSGKELQEEINRTAARMNGIAGELNRLAKG